MRDIRLTVPGRRQTYDIFVGNDILLPRIHELAHLSQYSKLFVITDKNLEKTWLKKLHQAVPGIAGEAVLPVGETAKNINTIQKIWTNMLAAGCDRKSLVLILGGGVVGDLGAFAASTYMRGIDFVQIPTTLLAQIDSSIGGKSGFDFIGLKNIIGTFDEPKVIVIDTDTLSTLPKRDLIAGFAEMIKYGLIRDAAFFDKLSKLHPEELSGYQLTELIARSVKIKVAIISKDEEEENSRKLVNFGHTIGHAIEALSWETDHPLLHGEAIAIGMVAEADLSSKIGNITADEVQRIRDAITAAGLPVKSPHFAIDRIKGKMRHDKKNEYGDVLFTLLKQIGHGVINQKVDESIVNQVIMENMEAKQ
ncbi:MAG TPA: 3-dehydroquinate synthase [Candidatus Saccharimonadales bacterium]|nr:3-dehydroquinate synthase [Candidatus Saccharimonadales bacterium]